MGLQGLNNFPEGSELLRIHFFGFQSLPSATSSEALPLSAAGLGTRAPVGWESGAGRLASCGFCGQILQSSGKERNVPIQSLGGCPGHIGAAGELLEKSCKARNSALQVVTSASVQKEPDTGQGPMKGREEVLVCV